MADVRGCCDIKNRKILILLGQRQALKAQWEGQLHVLQSSKLKKTYAKYR